MKRFLLALTTLTLIGCQQAPTPQTLQPLSFASMPKIRIAAAEIRVVEQYEPPLKAPNVEHMFPNPPTKAVNQWVADRLQAAGTSGLLEVSIEDASVVEVPLPKTDGVRGFFTDDQSERYDAKLRVTFRMYDGLKAASIAAGDVNVVHARSINEKATIQDRERLFDEMMKEMMMQFNSESENRLRQYFNAFLR